LAFNGLSGLSIPPTSEARPPAFGAGPATVPTARTADECRRVGNDLYRAAQALAQSHAADVEGITFGAEGGGYHADG